MDDSDCGLLLPMGPMAAPEPCSSMQVQDLLLQMRQDLLGELQGVVKVAHQETIDALGQHRILIVDQENSMRKLMARVLCTVARSGDVTQVLLEQDQDTEISTVDAEKQAASVESTGGTDVYLQEPERIANGCIVQAAAIAPRPSGAASFSHGEASAHFAGAPSADSGSVAVAVAAATGSDPTKEGAEGQEDKEKLYTGRGATWITIEHAQKVTDLGCDGNNPNSIFTKIVDSNMFHTLSLIMICLNAVYIGVEADWNTAASLATATWYFQLCEHIFTMYFFTELVLRFMAFQSHAHCLKDGWFMLDFAMVVMMVLETWIFSIAMAVMDSGSPPNTGAVGGIGRMFRLVRLTRMSKLMQVMPELVTMVKGMVAAIRAVHAALLILILLVYVFAIIMNALVGHEEDLAEYFPTVRDSMVTLLIQGVLLDEISGLVRAMIAVGNIWSLITLGVFVLISALTNMNMLIGMLCQVVIDVSAEEKENHVKGQMKDSLLVMLQDLDDDNSGELSKSEFLDVLNEPKAVALMKDIQVDTQHLLDLAEMLYTNEESTLPIAVIMNIVLTLRGKRQLTMDDLAKGQNFIFWALDKRLAEERELTVRAVQDAVRGK